MTRVRRRLLLATVLAASCGPPEEPFDPASVPSPDLGLVEEESLVEAVTTAREEVLQASASAQAWGHLGDVMLAHGWEAEAATCYREAERRDGREPAWPYLRGRSLETTDPAGALAAYDEARANGESSAALHLHRATVLRDLGRLDEARAALALAAQALPGHPGPQVGLGQVALERGDWAAAREHFLRAVALNPGQSDAHQGLAQAFLALGDPERAREHGQLGKRPPRDVALPDPHWLRVEEAGATRYWAYRRGDRYRQLGDDERAVAELSKAITDEQRDPMTWYDYGNALRRTGRTQEALYAYDRALLAIDDPFYRERVEPERVAKIHVNAGLLRAQTGDPASAERHWRQALGLDPGLVEATVNLARLLAMQGRTGEAAALLERHPERGTDPKISGLLAEIQDHRSAR